MSKHKKKMSKLNHSIRRFFDDDGFDEGIVRVEEATLTDLAHTLGVSPDEWNKEQLIRLFRRLWSEADRQIRQEIVSFFKMEGKVYLSDKEKVPTIERTDKINALLEQMDISRDEAVLLHNAYADVRTKKINRGKLEQSLAHLRYDKKRTKIEQVLEGKFTLDDRFEFNASLRYIIFDANFSKIQPLKSPVFSYTYLKESDIGQLIEEISTIKDELKAEKQHDLNAFLATLSDTHPYLKKEEILKALKSSPPDGLLESPSLSDQLLKRVLSHNYEIDNIVQNEHDVVIGIKAHYEKAEEAIVYDVHIALEKKSLMQILWQSKRLDVDEKLTYAIQQYEQEFDEQLESLTISCLKMAHMLSMTHTQIREWILTYLSPLLRGTLQITPRLQQNTLARFTRHIRKALLKHQRQELLARTIRDFKNLFPLAREMRRKLILHIGPTNSGKTYGAMQSLKKADTGYYLAPLRLLALEGYEDLRDSGIDVSLITGEEMLLNDDATHISSTIEMLNFGVDVDVCVIDEVQMIGDRDRGWAWANAIIGAPAKTIIMTGSPNAREAVQALADYLNEPLEIIEFERMNPLELMHNATAIANIQPGTAVIAFSRKDVLRIKQQLSRQFSVSVVYGNLSPEVRREEARRFREGETEVLVATDAIAMGMNLPIQTILFFKGDKFDGERQRPLTPSEIHQISGRAGRYGFSEKGYVGSLKPDVLQLLHKNFHAPAHLVSIPFKVMANLEHISLVGSILEESSLAEILQFFVKNMHFDGPFSAANLDSMLEAAAIVDRYELDLATKYHLASAPLTLKSPYIVASYERYLHALEKGTLIPYLPPEHLGEYALTTDELLQVEDRVKEISLYLWLSYRFEDHFVDADKARQYRGVLNRFIESSLKQSHFVPRCSQCTQTLPFNSKYSICQNCFHKLNQQKRREDRNKPHPKTQKRERK